jgi:thioredoxin reductase (NADPH)
MMRDMCTKYNAAPKHPALSRAAQNAVLQICNSRRHHCGCTCAHSCGASAPIRCTSSAGAIKLALTHCAVPAHPSFPWWSLFLGGETTSPTQAATLNSRTPTPSSYLATQNYPRYVNGKYVKAPNGLLFGMQPWQIGVVVVLAAGWVLGPNGGRQAGSGEADPMGLTGNAWAYKVADHPPGSVLDIRRHEQLLGALEYHRDVTNLPVVVDVYSKSCGPCRQIAPAFQQLAQTLAGTAVFIKLDSTQLPRTSMMLNVRSLPTFIFFKAGLQVHTFTGADLQQLQSVLAQLATAAAAEGTFASADAYPSLQDVQGVVAKHTPASSDQSADAVKAHADSVAATAATLHAKFAGMPATLQRRLRADYKDMAAAPATTREGTPATDTTPPLPDSPNTPTATAEDDDGATLPYLDFRSDRIAAPAGAESVVIIGGGPAGLSAAIYAARAGLRPLVVAPEEGGQLLGKGVGVENFPGIFAGADDIATGKQVVELMRAQALQFGTSFLRGVVVGVDLQSTPKRLVITSTNRMLETANVTISTRAVILTLGSKSRWLEVPGEELLKGNGVSACATCDGYLYRDKVVAVVGGGDSAMESALVLARTAKSVVVIHRKDSFVASQILVNQVKEHPSITIKWQSKVRGFVGTPETGLESVTVSGVASETTEAVVVAACFVAIGHDPNTEVLAGQVPLDSHNYVVLDNPPRTTVGVPGVFAAGDIADSQYRQAVTSAGTGAAAALDAERWLSETAHTQ